MIHLKHRNPRVYFFQHRIYTTYVIIITVTFIYILKYKYLLIYIQVFSLKEKVKFYLQILTSPVYHSPGPIVSLFVPVRLFEPIGAGPTLVDLYLLLVMFWVCLKQNKILTLKNLLLREMLLSVLKYAKNS